MNFDFLGLKKSIAQIQQRLEKVRLEQASIQNQIHSIQYAPTGADDIKNIVSKWVEESSNAYWAGFRASVQTAAKESVPTKGLTLKPLATFGAQIREQSLQMPTQQMGEAICAMFAPHILAMLHQQIDAIEWPENAIPISERAGKMEQLQKALSKLMEEEADLVQSARDAGLNVDGAA
jgi:hypothetical protein